MRAKIGNSNKSPIINTNAIKGWPGKLSLNCCLFLKSHFIRKAKNKGMNKIMKILSTRKPSSITPVVPPKIKR